MKKKTSDLLAISFPRKGMTEESIQNLRWMVEAKESLISKALGVKKLPIEVGDNEISFPWFSMDLSKEETDAYAQFIAALCKTAQTKKRVMRSTKAVENEKFRMRIFCIALGLVGPEYSLCRKLLSKPLSGNSAWSDGVDPRRKAATSPESAPVEVLPELEEKAPTEAEPAAEDAGQPV